MKCDIFIRSYDKDSEWLKYCVKSIKKYVSGINDIIITYPEKHNICKQDLCKNFEIKPIVNNGYIDQQITKLNAYKYCDSDTTHILFIDSDACFTNFFNPSLLLKNNCPIIHMTPYCSFIYENDKPALRWKSITENFLKINIDYEFMRQSPYLYEKQTLIQLQDWFYDNHNILLQEYLKEMKVPEISEFNLIGAFIYYFTNKNNYSFINTLYEPLVSYDWFLQNWSWGGLTEEIKNNLIKITS
jgi:hypothetical protein